MAIELEITGISNLGQGFGYLANDKNKTFISKTVTGDLVQAEIIRRNRKFTAANLTGIIRPSPNRKTAPCQYFSICGGCALQHLSDDFYQNFKRKNLQNLVNDLNFDQEINWVWIKEGSRRRVSFHINENNEIGFYKEFSNELVPISKCLMLESSISKLILPLKSLLNNLPNNYITQISATLADNGVDMVFYFKKLDKKINEKLIIFAKENKIIRLSCKSSNQLKIIFQSEVPLIRYTTIHTRHFNFFRHSSSFRHPSESWDLEKHNEIPAFAGMTEGDTRIKLKEVGITRTIELPPEIFLQATIEGQNTIISEINNFIKSKPEIKYVADLYCGVGTYSFALPDGLKITGFEGDEIMANNINKNAIKNNLQNFISAQKRDLVLNPLNIEELRNYDLVLINPPRNGAKSQVEILAKSKVKYIIMISCNPHSFKNDALILKNHGYKISALTAIDQFYYTAHLEVVAIFQI